MDFLHVTRSRTASPGATNSSHGTDLASRSSSLNAVARNWATRTINSSVRLYFESMKSGLFPPFERVEVPTGCAIFPGEIIKMPKSWAENLYNVTHWSRFDRGGHFAALEEPDLLVPDIRAFFRTVR